MIPAVNLQTAWQRLRLVQVLVRDGVIAYPTEAVWGLGCNPWSQDATEHILDLKRRPVDKGLILVASSVEQVRFLLAPLSRSLQDRALACWPGPVTCLLPDVEEQIPRWVRGRHESIAVRVSAHPVVRTLCDAFGGPLVSTSCNPAGRPPARTAWQVRRYFPTGPDLLVAGALGTERKPSRIVDITTGNRIR